GYLIMDSDLHMMEPDDLWARYLEAPYRTNPPRFFGGQQRQLAQDSADKGNADTIMGMEVQGLAIPAHANAQAATASSRELGRRLLQGRPATPQIRRSDRDARRFERCRGGAPQRQGTWCGRGHRHAEPGQRPAPARRGVRAAVGRAGTARRADRLSPDRQHLA